MVNWIHDIYDDDSNIIFLCFIILYIAVFVVGECPYYLSIYEGQTVSPYDIVFNLM